MSCDDEQLDLFQNPAINLLGGGNFRTIAETSGVPCKMLKWRDKVTI